MSVTYRITGTPLADIEIAPPRLMREIGEGLLTRIRHRTAKGTDANGAAFRSLSPLYAIAKHKALGHARADLTVSGGMLNGMHVRPQKNRVTLSFLSGGGSRSSGGTFIQRSRSVGAASKAGWHNDTGAGKSRVIREFFGLDVSDQDWATLQVAKHLRKTR